MYHMRPKEDFGISSNKRIILLQVILIQESFVNIDEICMMIKRRRCSKRKAWSISFSILRSLMKIVMMPVSLMLLNILIIYVHLEESIILDLVQILTAFSRM